MPLSRAARDAFPLRAGRGSPWCRARRGTPPAAPTVALERLGAFANPRRGGSALAVRWHCPRNPRRRAPRADRDPVMSTKLAAAIATVSDSATGPAVRHWCGCAGHRSHRSALPGGFGELTRSRAKAARISVEDDADLDPSGHRPPPPRKRAAHARVVTRSRFGTVSLPICFNARWELIRRVRTSVGAARLNSSADRNIFRLSAGRQVESCHQRGAPG